MQLSSSSASLSLQVQLYFPQVGHPAYGIVRGIVKDSTDFYQGLSSVTFLDSDGKVGWCSKVLVVADSN